jgi:hypothetical protein
MVEDNKNEALKADQYTEKKGEKGIKDLLEKKELKIR